MAGLSVLHANQCNDVTRLGAIKLDTLIGMHLDDAPDTFGLAGKGVEHGVTLLDFTGIDAGKGQRSEAVVHDLECQGAQRTVGIHDGKFTRLVTLHIHFRLRLNLGRAGR